MTHTADSPAPTRRIARERLARKREKVRAGAAAMRRETFHAGMWATRAPLWMWQMGFILYYTTFFPIQISFLRLKAVQT